MAETGIEDDDDFGDFGGFETAEPVEATVAECGPPSVPAAVTPWAVMAAAAPSPGSVQTDSGVQYVPGVGAQPTLQGGTSQDPGSEAGQTDAVPGSSQSQAVDDHSAATNWAALGEEVDKQANVPLFKANFDNLNTGATSQGQEQGPLSEEQPKTYVAGKSAGDTVGADDFDLDLDVSIPSATATNDATKESNVTEISSIPQTTNIQKTQEQLTDTQRQLIVTQEQLKESEAQQERMKEENISLQEDVAELRILTKSQTQDLSLVQEQLEQQRQKYANLQTEHQKDLDAIREAGHKALALVVEEYKEMCKVAVLEQQEECRRSLKDALAEQADEYKEAFNKQKEIFQKQLEEMQNSLKEKTQKSLETQREDTKVEIQRTLQTEEENNRKRIEQAIEESHVKHKKQMEEALEAERVSSNKSREQDRETWNKSLDGIREESLRIVKKAVEEEKEHCQACVREAVVTEAQRQKEAMSEVLKQAKSDVQQYVQEYKQADSRVRHRTLASIDVFLEGARQQLQLLLNPEEGQEENKRSDVQTTDSPPKL